MVKYKAEWKDVRAVFWLALFLGIGIGAVLCGAIR